MLSARLRRVAASRRRSPEGLAQEAVEQDVAREEARAAFVAEAEASWAEYQATGRHLTGAEVRRWLETWGTDTACM